MQKIGVLLLGLLCSFGAQAQIIRGTVSDWLTRQPIPGVVVYLDGTSVHTVTDARGEYELSTEKWINTSVVFYHPVYRAQAFPYPYTELLDKLQMLGQMQEEAEEMPREELFSRQDMLEVFRHYFFGNTPAGKTCTIHNEEEIVLWYDTPTASLHASSKKPLKITNPYLGYELWYEIETFRVKYDPETEGLPTQPGRVTGKKPLLGETPADSYRLEAKTHYFTDLAPDDEIIRERRNSLYQGSSIHFLQELSRERIASPGNKKTDFKFIDPFMNRVDPGKLFTVTDSLQMKLIKLSPGMDLENKQEEYSRPLYGFCRLLYKNRYYSSIIFFNPKFRVDDYGNADMDAGLLFQGSMAPRCVGEILPRNYTP